MPLRGKDHRKGGGAPGPKIRKCTLPLWEGQGFPTLVYHGGRLEYLVVTQRAH